MAGLDQAALAAAESACSDIVEYDSVYDYGYGGETFERQEVANMSEVVAAAVAAYMEAASDPAATPSGWPAHTI